MQKFQTIVFLEVYKCFKKTRRKKEVQPQSKLKLHGDTAQTIYVTQHIETLSSAQPRKHMNQTLILQIALIIVNCISLIVFGIDKFKSKRGGWRIPESRLLLVAFFGPFGAYSGMLLFRHKTRKIKFLLVPIFLIAQVFLIVYFWFF